MKNEPHKSRKKNQKSLNAKPMTVAERKRRSRLKLKNEGGKEYQMIIPKDEMELMKIYADIYQLDTNKALSKLFKEAREHISDVMTNAIEMDMSGATNNEVLQYLQTNLFSKPINLKESI